MNGRLGCTSDLEVFVTQKCNGSRVCTLTNATDIQWNRILDDVSTATVQVPIAIGAGTVNPCCNCLADIEPWCHELQIAREGEIVWQGPITKVTYAYTAVTIEAADVLVWTKVRVPIGTLSNAQKPTEVTDLALNVLNAAFAEDDPCVLKYVVQMDLGHRPTYLGPLSVPAANFPAFQDSYFTWLQHLSDIGLDFTTIGRRVVLSVDSSNVSTVLGTITDEHIMGEMEVAKDGFLMVNRAYVRYTKDDDAATCKANAAAGGTPFNTVPCPAEVDGKKYCYGPIERVFSDAVAFDLNTAKQIGQIYVNAGSISPRTIDFPSGSKLSPDTPFDINDLVPGQLIRVAFAGLCLEVFKTFKLKEVSYHLSANSDEEISISMTTPNAPGTSG